MSKARILLLHRLRDFLFSWGPVVVIVLLTRAFVVEAFMVPSGSMYNTIRTGDFLLVNKFIYGVKLPFTDRRLIPVSTPRRGDIIVFRTPAEPDEPQPAANYARVFPKWLPLFPLYWCKADNPSFFGHRQGLVSYAPHTLVKRCVAVAGDTVEVRDKRLYINGQAVSDSQAIHRRSELVPRRDRSGPEYQEHWERQGFAHEYSVRDNFGPVVVPAGHVIGMGDNRDNSWDSRFWGPIDLRYLRGKPLFLYFSYRFPTPPGVDESEYEVTGFNPVQILTHPFNVRLGRIGHILS